MEAIRERLGPLATKGSLDKTVDDIDAATLALQSAKERIVNDPSTACLTLAGLKKPVKDSLDKANSDLNDAYGVHNKYSKALDKKLKAIPPFTPEDDALHGQDFLINRAIAMHLLREGQFTVASTFMNEAHANPPPSSLSSSTQACEFKADSLQKQFADMYTILRALREEHNLGPAIKWARGHSTHLEGRGSNLEFELFRLNFVRIFTSEPEGSFAALAYARSEAGPFQRRYENNIYELAGAAAYGSNLAESPYRHTFNTTSAWDELASSFTREFCSFMGLSADSPLYVAATAGAIALPELNKAKTLMKANRTAWSTAQELPIEIPLPPAYHFHSIFVCPVSKEQATETNPPMLIPCGHVICKESLERISKGARFKCPYCPHESNPSQARVVYL